ncbi:MAG: hypothetical protein K8S56_09315, partial [Candidatus Cloacimonetes bacterium]|nr:hypothetical protein [Candidatus Cloacimonadota bacterium]
DKTDLLLRELIKRYHTLNISRQLLQRSLSSISGFMREEFPRYRIESRGGVHNFAHRSNKDGSGDFRLASVASRDGVSFEPLSDWRILDDNLMLGDRTEVSLSLLSSERQEIIAPYLARLICTHRALGSRMFHFLLMPDNIPTTLSYYRNGKRELFDMQAYSNLLLILNTWWNGRDISYTMTDVKMVNGFIEFSCSLSATDPASGKQDYAEIRYHLNSENMIDLVMLVLHEDVKKD